MQMIPHKSQVSSGPSRARLLAAILLGAGLIVLGFVVAFFVMDSGAAASGSSNTGRSIYATPAEVEFAAPELSLRNVNGEKQSLADFQGKIVLVNNWATWCPPCKEEMPALQTFYEKYQQQGFVLVAIEAGEPKKEVVEFISDYGLTFLIWLDPTNKSLALFHNNNLPSSYVIDRSGIVRLAWTGPVNLKILEEYITPLLED